MCAIPDEYQIAHVNGVKLIPLGTLPNRFTELDPNQQIYLHCKSGLRSMKAVKFLQERGYKYVKASKAASTPGPMISIPACRNIEET